MTQNSVLHHLAVLSLMLISELHAQFSCTGRWAYVCEGGKRRSLNNNIQQRPLDVRNTPEIADDNIPRADQSDDEIPEWFIKLLLKKQSSVDDENDVLELIKQNQRPSTHETSSNSVHLRLDDDWSAGENFNDRLNRVQGLARLLADGNAKANKRGDYLSENQPAKEILRKSDENELSARKQLLSKWLNEVSDV